MSIKLIIGVIVTALIVLGAYFMFFQKQTPQQISPTVDSLEDQGGLGSKLYEQVQSPAERVPDANPFQEQTNPFQATETNPFKGTYKNPFE